MKTTSPLLVWMRLPAGGSRPEGSLKKWRYRFFQQMKAALIWQEGIIYLAHGVLMEGVRDILMKAISLRPESVDDSAEMEKVGVMSSRGIEEETGREVEEGVKSAEKTMKLSQGNCVSLVLLLVFVFALLIEAGQVLLPASFQRGFSWGDLAASLVGGLVGCYTLLKNRLEMRAGYAKNK